MVLMVFFSSRISPRASTVILVVKSPLATAVVTPAMLRTWLVRLLAMELTLVGQILPGAGHAAHIGLAAQLAFGAHFARHARHFAGERVELIHHGVDGVLQLQNFAARVHRDLASTDRPSPPPWSPRAMLRTWDVRLPAMELTLIGQILPDAADALHVRLAAQLAFRAHFARHARHFAGERVELIHHGVDGVLQLQNFAAHVHRDLARQDRPWPRPWSLRRCCGPGWSGCSAMELTESVRSFQVPATPCTSAWPPSLPSVPTSRATRVTSTANELS